MDERRSTRTLYEFRDDKVLNRREAHITVDGDLVLEIYDLDPVLESMMGDSDYEKESRVLAVHMEKVRLLLGNEFGFEHTADRDAEVLDAIMNAFGGSIQACSKAVDWLDANKIPHEDWSY
jgi:hypothetical protein